MPEKVPGRSPTLAGQLNLVDCGMMNHMNRELPSHCFNGR